MKAFIHRGIRWMPEGVCRRALKAEAEIVEGDLRELLWDLAVYKYALQRVVDALWDLGTIPKRVKHTSCSTICLEATASEHT